MCQNRLYLHSGLLAACAEFHLCSICQADSKCIKIVLKASTGLLDTHLRLRLDCSSVCRDNLCMQLPNLQNIYQLRKSRVGLLGSGTCSLLDMDCSLSSHLAIVRLEESTNQLDRQKYYLRRFCSYQQARSHMIAVRYSVSNIPKDTKHYLATLWKDSTTLQDKCIDCHFDSHHNLFYHCQLKSQWLHCTCNQEDTVDKPTTMLRRQSSSHLDSLQDLSLFDKLSLLDNQYMNQLHQMSNVRCRTLLGDSHQLGSKSLINQLI